MAEAIPPPGHFPKILEAGETYPGQHNIEKRASFSFPLVTNKLRSYSFTGTILHFNETVQEWCEFTNIETAIIRKFTYRRQSYRLEEIALGIALLFDDNMIEKAGVFIKSKKLSTAEKPSILKDLKKAGMPNQKDYDFGKTKQKIRLGKAWFKYLYGKINYILGRVSPDLDDILEAKRVVQRTSLQWGNKLLEETYQVKDEVNSGNLTTYLDIIGDVVNNFIGLSLIETAPYRQAAYYAKLALVGVDKTLSVDKYLYNGLIVSDSSNNKDHEKYWQDQNLKENVKKNNNIFDDNWQLILEETLDRLQNVYRRIDNALLDGDQAYRSSP